MKFFYFSFGFTQKNKGNYVKIQAHSMKAAKLMMLNHFGAFYAKCYEDGDSAFSPVGLTEIPFDLQRVV